MMTRPTKAHYTLLTLSIMLTLALAGCRHDERLDRASTLIGSSPEKALDSLMSIDSLQLSTADRRMREFLIVKAMDKGYVTHTSDSIIRPALDYFKDHGPRELRAEVAYYGGRVYSDLGDYPSAINYYHDAIDLLPDDTDSLRLKASILSQTGRLLNTIRLYDKASECIGQAIEINAEMDDSASNMYDLQLLSVIRLNQSRIDEAEKLLTQSEQIAEKKDTTYLWNLRTYKARTEYERDSLQQALRYIRDVPENVRQISKPSALLYAMRINYAAGNYNEAYRYALELKSQPYNSLNAYQILLKPEIRSLCPSDSVDSYINTYVRLLDEKLTRNGDEQTLLQESYYNYQKHDRDREVAESHAKNMERWFMWSLVIIASLFSGIFFIKYRSSRSILRLRQTVDALEQIRAGLSDSNNNDATEILTLQNTNNLKEKIIIELKTLLQSGQNYHLPSQIIESQVFRQLRKSISECRVINENDAFWDELDEAVCGAFDKFKSRLHILYGVNLKPFDYHMALLIKCGISPTDMAIILGRAKGSISSRREKLCQKIFGQNLGVKYIDSVIRCL